jgi:hypothetical protein
MMTMAMMNCLASDGDDSDGRERRWCGDIKNRDLQTSLVIVQNSTTRSGRLASYKREWAVGFVQVQTLAVRLLRFVVGPQFTPSCCVYVQFRHCEEMSPGLYQVFSRNNKLYTDLFPRFIGVGFGETIQCLVSLYRTIGYGVNVFSMF